MKKVLKVLLCANAAAIFILNLAVQLNVINIDSFSINPREQQALADECLPDDCSLLCFCSMEAVDDLNNPFNI